MKKSLITKTVAVLLAVISVALFASCSQKAEDVIQDYTKKATEAPAWFGDSESVAIHTAGAIAETAGKVKDVSYYIYGHQRASWTLKIITENSKVYAAFENKTSKAKQVYELNFADPLKTEETIVALRTKWTGVINKTLMSGKWEKYHEDDASFYADAECDAFEGSLDSVTYQFVAEYYADNGEKDVVTVSLFAENAEDEGFVLRKMTDAKYTYPDTIESVDKETFMTVVSERVEFFDAEAFFA